MSNINKALASIALALFGLGISSALAFDEVTWIVSSTANNLTGGLYSEQVHEIGYSTSPLICGGASTFCNIAADATVIVNTTKMTGSFTAMTYVLVQGPFPPFAPPPFLPTVVTASYQSKGTFSLVSGSGTGKTQTTSGQQNICLSFSGAGSGIASLNVRSPFDGYALLEVDTNLGTNCP